MTVPTTIKLQPADWRWATWRPYTPLQRREPALFDLARATQKSVSSGTSWPIHPLPHTMSRGEAGFWLSSMCLPYLNNSSKSFNHQLREFLQETSEWTVERAIEKLSSMIHWRIAAELMIPLWNLFSPAEVYHIVNSFTVQLNYPITDSKLPLVVGFQQYVAPYLTEAERIMLREIIREDVQKQAIPQQYSAHLSLYLAAAVGGFSAELQEKIATLPDGACSSKGQYGYWRSNGIELIFGLDDPAKVERETRRLGHPLYKPEHLIGWLAHTETTALDHAYEGIVTHYDKGTAASLFKIFELIEDEAVIPWMLKLQKDAPGFIPAEANKWLNTHRELSAHGAAIALSAGGKDANEARDYLRLLKRKGYKELLNTLQLAPDAQERLKAEVLDHTDNRLLPLLPTDQTPMWLSDAVSAIQKDKKAKRPLWIEPEDLPQIPLNKQALTSEHINALLIALRKSTLDKPHPFVILIKANIEPVFCDQFAWGLFSIWLERGGDTKEKWALIAIGLLGNDTSVLKLIPLISKWPGELSHQRAVLGLDVLRKIGTDTALMQINSLSQKAQFKRLRGAAQKAIQSIADERNLTPEQLADRIVPDCGLDADGKRTFDYGARQFTLIVDPELKPMIRGEDGKLKPDLPQSNRSDDAEKATIAQAEWKLIKKQVRSVAKLQSLRLEMAMMSRRTWTPNEFKMFLVDHPLMIHLVRSLVWCGYNAERTLQTTFRVTDEKDYATVDDEPLSLDGFTRVGLVHVLQLTQKEIAVWGEVLNDYDRLPPFAQLGRKTYALNPDEIEETEIIRYKDVSIEVTAFIGILQKLGWQRGVPGDGGVYYEHSKPFPEDNVTAIVQYEGIPIGYLGGWNNQEIERCFLVPGVYKANEAYPKHEKRIPLGEVNRVIMSEVLRDLELIASKGKS